MEQLHYGPDGTALVGGVEMTTVYVVSDDSYSDYRVLGIASTPEKSC